MAPTSAPRPASTPTSVARPVSGQTVTVPAPQAGQVEAVTSSPAGNLHLSFDPSTATSGREGNSLTFQVDNGGKVTITDFFAVGNEALPTLTLPDGTQVAAAEYLKTQNPNLDLTTAAGPAGASPQGSGEGSYADDAGSLMGGVDKMGSLGTDQWSGRSLTAQEFTQSASLLSAGAAGIGAGGTGGGDGPQPDAVPYQARGILYMGQDDQGTDNFSFEVLKNAATTSSRNVHAQTADGYEHNYGICTPSRGGMTYTLTQEGKDALAALPADENLYDYITVTVDGQSYTMQIVINHSGSFDSAAQDAADVAAGLLNTGNGSVIWGEWHSGQAHTDNSPYNVDASHGNNNLFYNNGVSGDASFGSPHDGMKAAVGFSGSLTTHEGMDAVAILSNKDVTGMADWSFGAKDASIDTGDGGDAVHIEAQITRVDNDSAGYAIGMSNSTVKIGEGDDIILVAGRGEGIALSAVGMEMNSLVDAGDGNDTIYIRATAGDRGMTDAIEESKVDAGDGDNLIIVDSYAGDGGAADGMIRSSIVSGSGKDNININVAIGDQLRGGNYTAYGLRASSIDSGAGDDSVSIAVTGGRDTTVTGLDYRSSVSAGEGNDKITISASVTSGTAIGVDHGSVVDSGAGNDTITIKATAPSGTAIGVAGGSVVDGGTGNDSITIVAATAAVSSATVKGGLGSDTITLGDAGTKSGGNVSNSTIALGGNTTGVDLTDTDANFLTVHGNVDASKIYGTAGKDTVLVNGRVGGSDIAVGGGANLVTITGNGDGGLVYGSTHISSDAGSGSTLNVNVAGTRDQMAFQAGAGMSNTVQGFDSVNIKTDVAGTGWGYGMRAEMGGANSIEAGNVNIDTVVADKGAAYGMYSLYNSVNSIKADNVNINAAVAGTGSSEAAGMQAQAGNTKNTITADGEVAIKVSGAGSGWVSCMTLQGGQNSANTIHAGGGVHMDVSATGTGSTFGMGALGTGNTNSIEAAHVEMNVTGGNYMAYGMWANDKSVNSIETADYVNMTVTGTRGGVQAMSADSGGTNSIKTGDVHIAATTAAGSIYGIMAMDNGKNTIEADVKLDVAGTSASSSAYGVYAFNKGENTLTGTSAEINVSGGYWAYGLYATGDGTGSLGHSGKNTLNAEKVDITATAGTLRAAVFASGDGSFNTINAKDVTLTGGMQSMINGQNIVNAVEAGSLGKVSVTNSISGTATGSAVTMKAETAGGNAIKGGNDGNNITLTADTAISGGYAAGIYSSGSGSRNEIVTGAGKDIIEVSVNNSGAITSNSRALGMYANGSSNTIDAGGGDNVISVKSAFAGAGGNLVSASGMNVYANGSNTIKAGDGNNSISVEATNKDGAAYGMYIGTPGGVNSILTGSGDDVVTVGGNSDKSGFAMYAGNFGGAAGTGSNVINTGTGNDRVILNGGMSAMDAGMSNTVISGGSVTVNTENQYHWGVSASTGGQNTVQAGTDISVVNKRSDNPAYAVTATGNWGATAAQDAPNYALNNLTAGNDINLTAVGVAGAFGVAANGNAASKVTAHGDVFIDATAGSAGTSTAAGIFSQGGSSNGRTNGGVVEVTGDSVGINAEAGGVMSGPNGGVYGMKASDGGNTSVTADNAVTVTAKATAAGGTAYGMYSVDKSHQTIQAGPESHGIEVRITAQGGSGGSYAMYAANGSIGNDKVVNTIKGSAFDDAIRLHGDVLAKNNGLNLIDAQGGHNLVWVDGTVTGERNNASWTMGQNVIKAGAGEIGTNRIVLDGNNKAYSNLSIETHGAYDILVLKAASVAEFTTQFKAWLDAMKGSITGLESISVVIDGVHGGALPAGLNWLTTDFPLVPVTMLDDISGQMADQLVATHANAVFADYDNTGHALDGHGHLMQSAGDDLINIKGDTNAAFYFENGGHDALYVEGAFSGQVGINGTHNGTIDVRLGSLEHDGKIILGNESDHVGITGDAHGEINLGGGNDSLSIGGHFDGLLSAGVGNDSVHIEHLDTGAGVSMGWGNDSLSIGSIGTGVRLMGDQGMDTLSLGHFDQQTFKVSDLMGGNNTISGFEVLDLTSGSSAPGQHVTIDVKVSALGLDTLLDGTLFNNHGDTTLDSLLTHSTLRVTGDAADTLTLNGYTDTTKAVTYDGQAYHVYQDSDSNYLLIAQNITNITGA